MPTLENGCSGKIKVKVSESYKWTLVYVRPSTVVNEDVSTSLLSSLLNYETQTLFS